MQGIALCAMKQRVLFIIGLTLAYFCSLSQVTLIPAGSTWKYLDNGTDQGTVWVSNSFNDASWASGNAELGYGDGDEATVVSYGPSSSSKYITTYFRKTINVPNPNLYSLLTLELVRDDGAVVYVNGTEVFRTNMPSGAINYTTPASSAIAWPFEDDWHTVNLSPALLLMGNNVIAVEIHQDNPSSSDISFNLKLTASTTLVVSTVSRGPYLQMATPNSMTFRWRTATPTDSKVQLGSSPSSLSIIQTHPGITTEHEVTVSGLTPDTQYYYNIGSFSAVLAGNLDPSFYFKTPPLSGTGNQKYRFWVIGDAGEGNNDQRAVRNAYYSYLGTNYTNAWLMLGDNAYDNGSDNNYQSAVFQNMYETILRNSVLYPAPGNHDYGNFGLGGGSLGVAYYNIFTLPNNAQAGGYPSGTEQYYSWNYGNVHFICLDSHLADKSTTGAMATWLVQDLAANTLPWVIAYWHHPPYTKGSHDSDVSTSINHDYAMGEMRSNILPILENGGVDLVLSGHSHSYERSFLIDSHYGLSSTLTISNIKDNSSGRYPYTCAYNKNTSVSKAHKGTVYSVVGCSAKLSGVASGWPHPAMYAFDNTLLGSMVLEIEGNRLDAKFLTSTGSIADYFSIMKNAGGKKSTYTVCEGDSITLSASWNGNYFWNFATLTGKNVTVTPSVGNHTYIVNDGVNCLRDSFVVTVIPTGTAPCITTTINLVNSPISSIQVSPNPVPLGEDIHILCTAKEPVSSLSVKILDLSGKILYNADFSISEGQQILAVPTAYSGKGMQIIQIETDRFSSTHRIILE